MDNQLTTGNKTQISVPSEGGARIRTYYMDRQKIFYPIDEGEIKHLSVLNSFTAGFSAAATALGMKSFDLWTAATIDKPMATIFTIGAVICAVIGYLCIKSKNTEFDRIKKEAMTQAN